MTSDFFPLHFFSSSRVIFPYPPRPPPKITPVRTARLRALLDDLSLVNAAICSPDDSTSAPSSAPASPSSPSSNGGGSSQPTSKIRATVAAAKWALQLRRLYLAGRWAAIETWCGVAGPATLLCPETPSAALQGVGRADQPSQLLPPHMAFSLADFPAIEVERDNALWQCGYHAHVTLLLSQAARPVFAVPVLRVPPVAPELLFAPPPAAFAVSDAEAGADAETPRAAPLALTPYPPAFLGVSDWTSFSADNVAALAALEQGGAFCRKYPGAVPLLEWCVSVLGEFRDAIFSIFSLPKILFLSKSPRQ